MANLYDYERLGPFRFQNLVGTLLRNLYGENLETFREGPDGGADAIVKINASSVKVIQVKYKSKGATSDKRVFSELKSTLKTELIKPAVMDLRVIEYNFVSNYKFSSDEKKELENVVKEIHPNFNVIVWGRTDLDESLNSGRVRFHFPELLNFTQFFEIIHAGFSEKQKNFASVLSDNMRTFISTAAFRKALHKLETNHFVVLSGAPKSGKTCTAEALAYAFMMQEFRAFEIRSVKEFFDVMAMPEKCVLICDDIFGDIVHDGQKTESWSRDFKLAVKSLGVNKKLIWTTRSYILVEAFSETKLKESIERHKSSFMETDVNDLTIEEKSFIVKSHFSQAKLTSEQKSILVKLSPNIVKHSNFNPESIRILAERKFLELVSGGEVATSRVQWEHIDKYLNQPADSWKQAYRKCSDSEKNLLKLIALSGNDVARSVLVEKYAQERLRNKSLDLFDDVFGKLDKSFIKMRGQSGDEERISFHHPSIKDMLIESINSDLSERVDLIPVLSFSQVSNQLFPGSRAHVLNDTSDFHRLKMTSRDEILALRGVFKSLLPEQQAEVLVGLMSNVVGPKADSEAKDIFLKHLLSPEVFINVLKSEDYGRVAYLENLIVFFERGLIKCYPTLPVDFSKTLKLDLESPLFWNFLKLFSKIYAVEAAEVISYIDVSILESSLLERVDDLIAERPTDEPKDEYDVDYIKDWRSSAEDFTRLASQVMSCIVFPNGKELDDLNDQLQDGIYDLPDIDMDDGTDYYADQQREDRMMAEEEDAYIMAIISEEES